MTSTTDNQLLDMTKELVAIESTTHNPKGLQEAHDFMAQLLLNSGKDITIEKFNSGGKPSFLAYKGKTRPARFHVILNGHVDVVPGKPNQFKLVVKNGRLYGRGVYDMKAACVVLADVFCEFVDKVPFALGLQIVTDEESGGKHGTLHQIQTAGVRTDFIICGECGRSTTVHEIANEAKGAIIADIGFKGKSAHGAYPWRGESAAIKAAGFINNLVRQYPMPTAPTTSTTIAITSVSAISGAFTMLADYATVGLDIRYVPGDQRFHNEDHFKAFIKQISPDAEIAKINDRFAPYIASPSNPLLVSLKQAAEQTEGAPFSLVRRNATSDGRFYGVLGDPACEFGIAGENQHGDDEYIPIQAFKDYRQTMRTFLAAQIATPAQELVHQSTQSR